ncbi:MAG: hypothetical protein ABFD18_17455 [Syntrophomonas sp.]
MTTFYYFLQSLPESMGLIALSLAITKVPLRWGRILLGGVIISVISYIIRSLPVTFGFHMPVMLFVLFVLIVKSTNIPPSHTIIALFSGFFTLALLEYLISSAFFAYTHMDPNNAMANETLWTSLGVIQAIILNIIALVVQHFLKPVEASWKI